MMPAASGVFDRVFLRISTDFFKYAAKLLVCAEEVSVIGVRVVMLCGENSR